MQLLKTQDLTKKGLASMFCSTFPAFLPGPVTLKFDFSLFMLVNVPSLLSIDRSLGNTIPSLLSVDLSLRILLALKVSSTVSTRG